MRSYLGDNNIHLENCKNTTIINQSIINQSALDTIVGKTIQIDKNDLFTSFVNHAKKQTWYMPNKKLPKSDLLKYYIDFCTMNNYTCEKDTSKLKMSMIKRLKGNLIDTIKNARGQSDKNATQVVLL